MPAAKLTRADREHVKATAIATGSLAEAARRHGLELAHVRQLAKRGNWPIHSRAVAAAQRAEDAALTAKAAAGVTMSQPASDAIAAHMAEHSGRTRIALATAATRYAEHVAEVPDDELVEHARAAKDWSGTAATVHGWGAEQGSAQTLIAIQIDVG